MNDWFVTQSGSSIYLEDAGRGRPLLALHGLGGGAYFFRGLAARLASACRVVSIDLPGTGWSSSGDAAFSVESWVEDLADLITRRVGEPAVILGHSMGTILALDLWRAAPETIAGIVFANGLPRVRAAIHERLSERADHVDRHGLGGWGRRVSPGIFAAESLRRAPEMVGLFERLFEAQNPANYVRWTRLLLGASAEKIVGSVRCPCLAITGRDDQYAPPDAVAAFVRGLPNPTELQVFAECGHMPFFEAPEAFAASLARFMEQLDVER